MAIAVSNETSHVRVIERMETSPSVRCLNKSGRLPQKILYDVEYSRPQFPLIRLLQRVRQETIKIS